MKFDDLKDRSKKGKRDYDLIRSRVKLAIKTDDENKIDEALKEAAKVRGWLTWWGANSKPLRRFLNKNVGRNYDALYSELCATFTRKQWRYFLDSALRYLVVNGGATGFHFRIVNGVLCKIKQTRYRYKKDPPLLTDHKYIRLAGIWYEVRFAETSNIHTVIFINKISRETGRFPECYVPSIGKISEVDTYINMIIRNHFEGQCPIGTRQLAKAEIKRLKLNDR